MKYFFLIFAFLCSCGLHDDYEKNKKLNFDTCNKSCLDNNKTMKHFEQGLGYVICECECQTKDSK
jgi:hypothetical protein